MTPGIMPYITIANIACGFHGSDPTVMHKTVRLAKANGVKVGAHPSLPDLQGFGRREMKMDPKELTDCLIYQVGALKAFLDAEGMPLNHIKPHGALYGMAARSEEIAGAICDAADVFGVALLGMAGTKHEEVYVKRGFRFIPEFYVDLDYDKDGRLIITREHDGLGSDPGGGADPAGGQREEGQDGGRQRHPDAGGMHLRAFRHARRRRRRQGRQGSDQGLSELMRFPPSRRR